TRSRSWTWYASRLRIPCHPRRMRPRDALTELRKIAWRYRRALVAGLALMLVNRLATFVLPSLSKVVIDEVILHRRFQLLAFIVVAGIAAVLLETATAFASNRVLSI